MVTDRVLGTDKLQSPHRPTPSALCLPFAPLGREAALLLSNDKRLFYF